MGPESGPILQVDLGAVVENWRSLQRHHPSGSVGAVVKADAYGLGAGPVAARLFAAGCRDFFVAHLGEAVALAQVAPGARLYVLNGLRPGEDTRCASLGAWPVLGSLEEIARWAARGPAVLHVDTGMARTGLSATEVEAVRGDPTPLAGVDWRYVLSHLVASECPDDPVNARQAAAMAGLAWLLPVVPRSLANSSGIFLGEGFGSALARPGAALYGINPTPHRSNPMRDVVRLMAPVVQVRVIPAGATVGYNGAWRATRPSRIATVCLGYADGFSRALLGRGAADFDGRRVPLVGRVSMDLTTFDVTDIPAVGPGSRLELIGPARTLADLAREAGTNEYEVLTSLGRRIRRIYA